MGITTVMGNMGNMENTVMGKNMVMVMVMKKNKYYK